MNYNSNLKTWGAVGTEQPDAYSYKAGERPIDEWDNFVQYNVIEDIKHLVGVTNDDLLLRSGGSLLSDLSVGDYGLSGTAGSVDFGGTEITVDGTFNVLQSITEQGNRVYSPNNQPALGDLSNVTAAGEGHTNGLDADTVDGAHGADLGANSSVSNDGIELMSSVDDINFTGYLTATNDGDGTATIDSTHDHDSRYANIDSGGSEAPVYATLADVPAIPVGAVVYVQDENKLFVEDGN